MIVEVKPFEKSQRDDMIMRTKCVRPLFEKEGDEYIVLTEREIRREPRISNIKLLHKYASTRLDYQHQILLYGFIKDRNTITLQEVEGLYASTGMGRQIVLALIWHGFLNIDINQKIAPETIIHMPSSNDNGNQKGGNIYALTV